MFSIGDIVEYWTYNDNDQEICYDCKVVGEFYEEGDPIQAVDLENVRTGVRYGGVDSQDCRMLVSVETLAFRELQKHIGE